MLPPTSAGPNSSPPDRVSDSPGDLPPQPAAGGAPGGRSGNEPSSARVDAWLWAVRLTKTRSVAANACRSGHVKVNGKTAKPSTLVRVGDHIEARLAGRERVVDVRRVLIKRVGAAIAVECFVDHSPPPPERDPHVPLFAVRDKGAGRPTKRDRRQIDRLRGRRD